MIVSEHEQVSADRGSIPSDQSEQTQDIIKRANELLTRAKRHRKKYDSDWHYNYEFVCSGRQWPMDRPRWRFNETVNITWSAIMTEIGLQTDARPKFEFAAQEFGDEQFVDVLRDINDRNWERHKWSSVVQDCLFDCKIYHVAHAIVEWDPELEYGLGDVSMKTLDPFYCYWDPMASDVNKGKQARYFIYAEPVPTQELKRKWPEFKDKIKPDVQDIRDRKDGTSVGTNMIFTSFDPYTPTRLPSSASNTAEKFGGEQLTTLIRLWLRDDALEEVCEEKEELDPSTGEKKKEYILKKKYPQGRYIEIANNCLLRDTVPGVEIDGEWVPYDDDCFPIARLVNYAYPREYVGENEVTHTKGPQKIVNYIWSYILDMFKMQGNPVTIIDDSANVDEETITNEPGNIIKTSNVNGVRREPGTPIDGGAFNLLSVAQGLLDKVQGLQDVSRGADISNVTSNVMLEGYLEAAQTRPRLKNRNLDLFLQDAGELVVKRMMQFYTLPRVFRVTNKEGYPEFIEFYLPVDENGKKVVKVKKRSTVNGKVVESEQQTLEYKGVPDVRVVSGSMLPYAKAQKANMALTYFNSAAIDQEELLKTVDWPNFEEVLRRMAKEKAEQLKAAQAAAAQEGAA